MSENVQDRDATGPTCPKCGVEFNQPLGLCPRCVLAAAVQAISADDHPSLAPMVVSGKCPSIESLNSQFSDFTFHELLGRGGSGWTFLATQKQLARQVAIKLTSRAVSRSVALERFQQEAGNLAQLNHPSIVTVHDFGVTDQFLYIVMEYVAGMTLRGLINNGKVPAEEVRNIGIQLCDAMEYAHGKGLVHRDIKPENILVVNAQPEVEIRVADFGISRMVQHQDSVSELTQTGLIIGTPFYMAPEQQVPGKMVDRRADIFSMGVVLYELLTGRLPQGNFSQPSLLSNCGPGMDRVVMKALSNDPDHRFETAAEVRSSLASVSNSPTSLAVKRLLLLASVLAVGTLLLLTLPKLLDWNSKPDTSGGIASVEDNLKVEKNEDETKTDKVNESDPAYKVEQPQETEQEQPVAVPETAETVEIVPIPKVYARLLLELNSRDFRRIKAALTALKNVPPDPEIDEITERVHHLTMASSTFVSGDALAALPELNVDKGVAALEAAIQDQDHFLKLRADKILIESGKLWALPLLEIRLNQAELNSAEISRILEGLAKIGPESEPILRSHLELILQDPKTESWVQKKTAVEALATVATVDSLELLEEIANGGEPFIGKRAANAVARIRSEMGTSKDQPVEDSDEVNSAATAKATAEGAVQARQ